VLRQGVLTVAKAGKNDGAAATFLLSS
jgi:hypothetical protein